MLFLTICFITFISLSLVRGNLFHDKTIKLGELNIKYHESNKQDTSLAEQMFKEGIGMLLFAITVLIAYVIYYLNAVDIDVYKYPTIIMISWLVFNLVINFKKKKENLETPEGRQRSRIELYTKKRHTVRHIIVNLMHLTYFIYMFYILVF